MTGSDSLYQEHVRTRQAKAEATLTAHGFDSLILSSGKPFTYFADDQEAPLHTTPHFTHWLPLAGAGNLLVVRPGIKPQLIHLVPDDFWREHQPITDSFWKEEFDIVEVKSIEHAWKIAGALAHAAYIGDEPERARAAGVIDTNINPAELVAQLDTERSYKTPYEVACIEEAQARAAAGHKAAKIIFEKGGSELAIHQAYMAAVGCTENELPYETITALDKKAAILHYQHKRAQGSGTVLLLDAGFGYNGYASDITRTWALESADPLFKELLARMETLQQEMCAQVLPNIVYADVHLKAHLCIGTLLNELGIITVSGEAAMEHGITKAFFPHGIGHMLGIQVHDVGGTSKTSDERLHKSFILEEGQVITIEPGVYFIPMLLSAHRSGVTAPLFNWDLIDRLTPSGGIRIEDDILVGKTGPINLTRKYLP